MALHYLATAISSRIRNPITSPRISIISIYISDPQPLVGLEICACRRLSLYACNWLSNPNSFYMLLELILSEPFKMPIYCFTKATPLICNTFCGLVPPLLWQESPFNNILYNFFFFFSVQALDSSRPLESRELHPYQSYWGRKAYRLITIPLYPSTIISGKLL